MCGVYKTLIRHVWYIRKLIHSERKNKMFTEKSKKQKNLVKNLVFILKIEIKLYEGRRARMKEKN